MTSSKCDVPHGNDEDAITTAHKKQMLTMDEAAPTLIGGLKLTVTCWLKVGCSFTIAPEELMNVTSGLATVGGAFDSA